MKTKQTVKFSEAVNWEWVHAHHAADSGKVSPEKHPHWIGTVIKHARRNGYAGQITPQGAAREINKNLY